MKLDIDLSAIFEAVEQMGASIERKIHLDELDPLDIQLETSSVEVNINDVEAAPGGLLSYKGRQILLYIEDHGSRVEEAIADGSTGRKYHIADCRTLKEMRQKGRFERYVVTRKLDGIFSVIGTSSYDRRTVVEGEASLCVCKNCLKHLNYKGCTSDNSLGKIFSQFSLKEFFTKYSTFFKNLPQSEIRGRQYGYPDDWPDISQNYRESVGYQCEKCAVSLKNNRGLLHTHHKNGIKSDNKKSNLIALCADCHRKEPFHGTVYVHHDDMQTINMLRKEQNIIHEHNDWREVLDLADPALEGFLLTCKRYGVIIPKIGYEVRSRGTCVRLELAWPHRKIGVAIDPHAEGLLVKEGWDMLHISEFINNPHPFVENLN